MRFLMTLRNTLVAMVLQNHTLNVGDAFHPGSIGQRAVEIGLGSPIFVCVERLPIRTPGVLAMLTEDVVVLERPTNRVDFLVTSGAVRILAVLLQLIAQGETPIRHRRVVAR